MSFMSASMFVVQVEVETRDVFLLKYEIAI